ncbi:chromatin modification-related protein EAF7-domain-containing protein [Cristinia sonorae]|uniref:Chromatin modification-related protein EAF7-domain-containing protein n=1 Tax=Cristinia sonorae TaxID=1940300 RepID=A0A8K0UWR8_9AGAR|nr:chromatin modification-related protein EAF7-domain-containing protein [Cristinia sonorae]
MAADDMDVDETASDYGPFLNTVEGEISLFRAVMRTRPVGIHRHFHVLAIRNAIHRDTGQWVTSDDIWEKLSNYYDMDALESLEMDGYETPNSKSPSPSHQPVNSPSPSDNLSLHPYFRDEYSLPADETIDAIISTRRMRSTASLPSSSPAPSPPAKATRSKKQLPKANANKGRGGGPGNKKSNLAGLVAGDSDSSALTQDSGDEGEAATAREGSVRLGSVATGTDAGTEEPEGEEEDEQETEPTKGRKKGKKGGGGTVRTRRTSVSAPKPPPKKRKR